MLIGALEAGGTKMVCAVGREDGTILEQMSIPTTTPEETLPKIVSYFKETFQHAHIKRLAEASGPGK